MRFSEHLWWKTMTHDFWCLSALCSFFMCMQTWQKHNIIRFVGGLKWSPNYANFLFHIKNLHKYQIKYSGLRALRPPIHPTNREVLKLRVVSKYVFQKAWSFWKITLTSNYFFLVVCTFWTLDHQFFYQLFILESGYRLSFNGSDRVYCSLFNMFQLCITHASIALASCQLSLCA